MTPTELIAKRKHEADGWRVLHSGAPDFFEYRKIKGRLEIRWREIKQGTDKLSSTQKEVLGVLQQMGFDAVVEYYVCVPAGPALPDQSVMPSQHVKGQPVVSSQRVKVLDAEEENLVRQRLTEHRQSMKKLVPGYGEIEKQMRAFFLTFQPDKPTQEWNYQDWLKVLDFFDEIVKTQGIDGLVRRIQLSQALVEKSWGK